MKSPEILQPLTTLGTAMETALLTTIHLINDRIFTETTVISHDEDDYENAYGEFFCAGI